MGKYKKINMNDFGFSNVGDLTQLAKDIHEVFNKHFPGGKPAFGVAFLLGPNYNEAHWVNNMDRQTGIKIFWETADKMEAKIN